MKTVFALGLMLVAGSGAFAQSTTTNSYTQTNLVSDVAGMAVATDAHLKNPWGMSLGSGTPWWVSDQVTGVTTVYSGTGTVEPLVVTIPAATGTGTGSPTGTAYLSNFVFVTLDGTIQLWTGSSKTEIEVNNSGAGAIYTGVTVFTSGATKTLYVANSKGAVEAYNAAFKRVTLAAGAFADSMLPAGYTPYGIQAIGPRIYVTFTKSVGAGAGYVDAFNSAGKLLLRLQHGAWMNEPWALAQSPAGFGKFGSELLVGNTGPGRIAAFNAKTGKYLGSLDDTTGKPIAIPGLWALAFGTGGSSGPTSSLYFAAGIGKYTHGLFGVLTAN